MMKTTKNISSRVLQQNGGMPNLSYLKNIINGILLWRKIFETIHVVLTQIIGLLLSNIGGSQKQW
jgi:hypothetical protein